ncbi:hypothetical protein E2562_036991 [Oryza meyeriana var. granulata]|uniref:Uncharacterized protein n=1 Tax=Oryza meyeriana var. granulata TaxID=110450 RepID=A0A6G1F1X7_9ORYZ|nr:hypothetical protein E2562_036991 [Oryza meyeriana var. granulata]
MADIGEPCSRSAVAREPCSRPLHQAPGSVDPWRMMSRRSGKHGTEAVWIYHGGHRGRASQHRRGCDSVALWHRGQKRDWPAGNPLNGMGALKIRASHDRGGIRGEAAQGRCPMPSRQDAIVGEGGACRGQAVAWGEEREINGRSHPSWWRGKGEEEASCFSTHGRRPEQRWRSAEEWRGNQLW